MVVRTNINLIENECENTNKMRRGKKNQKKKSSFVYGNTKRYADMSSRHTHEALLNYYTY